MHGECFSLIVGGHQCGVCCSWEAAFGQDEASSAWGLVCTVSPETAAANQAAAEAVPLDRPAFGLHQQDSALLVED